MNVMGAFKESNLPNEISTKLINDYRMVLGPAYVSLVLQVIFYGISSALNERRSLQFPVGVVISDPTVHNFIAGAKLERVWNTDDPTNPSASQWSYTWTFYPSDMEHSQNIDSNQPEIEAYIRSGADRLVQGGFAKNSDMPNAIGKIISTMIQCLKNWLINTAESNGSANLSLDGVFEATAKRNANGEIELGLVPSGSMKKVAKDDLSIQNN